MRFALVLLAALSSGCVFDAGASGDAHVLSGGVELQAATARPTYDALSQSVSVDVEGSVRSHDVRSTWVDVYLAPDFCSRYGPDGTPSSPLDHQRIEWPQAGQLSYHATLRAKVSGPMHVYVNAQADGAIGPIFGQCIDVVA